MYGGIYRAKVVDVTTDDLAYMQIPQLFGASAVQVPAMYTGGGTLVYGDTVWVMFEGGDKDNPYYLPRPA